MHNTVYWIWLSLSCSYGTATFPRLIEKFGSAKTVYDADIKDIIKCIDPRSSDRTRLSNKSLDRAYEIFEFCNSKKVGILTYDDERYPGNLKKIPSPPVVLYYRGILPDFNSGFYISMVGTRAISDYGRKNAFKISYDLASSGATIVSGMAMGIDGISHAAALETGKNTIAVLGSGIDVCYPSQHLTLARSIVKNGCIITEFPPHTPPARNNFPIRNRIISGLSELTIVIEGKEKSGARITAAHALEQGRALYALPGNIESSNSELTNLLLKNGAKIITTADDIIRDYQDKYPGILNPFNLSVKLPVDIMDTLTKYSVAATSPSDDIFSPPVRSKKKEAKAPEKAEAKPIEIENDSTVKTEFDARTFNVYTKIPTSGDCSIESLVDGEYSLRDVMKCLLKLEMGHFITMLPGERVSRKSN